MAFLVKLILVSLVSAGLLYSYQNNLFKRPPSAVEAEGLTLQAVSPTVKLAPNAEEQLLGRSLEEEFPKSKESLDLGGLPTDTPPGAEVELTTGGERIGQALDSDTPTENSGLVENALNPTQINELAHDCIYQIDVENRSGKMGGTAFACSDPSILVTNFHVLRGADTISIRDVEGTVVEFKGVLGWDVENDLAVIQILGARSDASLDLADSLVRIGEPVVVVGNPSGLIGSVSTGIVSALRGEDGPDILQLTAPISEGSSGSPVLNSIGKVIGVATATYSGDLRQNLNFASHYKASATLLKSCKSEKPGDLEAGWITPSQLDELPFHEQLDSDESSSPDWGLSDGAELSADMIVLMKEAWRLVRSDRLVDAHPILDELAQSERIGLVNFKFLCVAFAGGHYGNAITCAERSLVDLPHSVVIWTALGECYLKTDQPAIGWSCLKESVREDSSFFIPWVILGIELRMTKRYQSAGIYANKVACGLHPGLRDLFAEAGMWLPEMETGDQQKWKELYSTYFWVEVEPTNVDHWLSHFHTVRQWEGMDRAKRRLEVALSSTDQAPDLLDLKESIGE